MDNKIIGIIQKSMSNMLITDSDSSISYHTSIKNNNYSYQPDIKEIINIFNETPYDIFKCDTSKSIVFVLKDDIEISLSEYQKYVKKIQFIKIYDNDISRVDGDNSILINVRTMLKICKWTKTGTFSCIFDDSDCVDKKYASSDFEGYQHTYNNVRIRKGYFGASDYYPAFKYVMSINKFNNYQAYMPACGELLLFFKYRPLIDYILQVINMKPIELHSVYQEYLVWTSTEYNKMQAFLYNNDSNTIYPYLKSASFNVIPFFKKIN